MSNEPNWQIHANANQHGRDWTIRVTATRYDSQGFPGDPVTFRTHMTMPEVSEHADMAWIALVNMIHLLERDGAIGRISAVSQARLF